MQYYCLRFLKDELKQKVLFRWATTKEHFINVELLEHSFVSYSLVSR